MLSYEGIFFEEKECEILHSLENKKLPIINDKLHCTFKYKPIDDEIFNDIVGKSFEIYIIGYGNDGKNSGFSILLPDELKPYYINYEEENSQVLKIPHITTSLEKGAKATNTKNLYFMPLKNTIKLVGKFGYWIKEEKKEYLSYEPYTKSFKK